MAGMLARRDQENLAHSLQQAAASKPLNQIRPKTPSAKSGRVTFDENAVQTVGKPIAKGGPSKSFGTAGKANVDSFATPAATRNRAPLGAKTTNAKAKPFGTPVLQQKANDKAKSGSATRRQSLKLSQTEPVKLDILQSSEDDLPEIEYMPPPAKDIPDIPEELENPIDLSMFENGGMQYDFLYHLRYSKGSDGKSMAERECEREQLLDKLSNARDVALAEYNMEYDMTSCLHDSECPTKECLQLPERRRAAKEKYDARLVEIQQMDKSSIKQDRKADHAKGPSDIASRKAASALALRPASITATSRLVQTPKTGTSFLSRTRQPQTTTIPTNPSSMRHTAAVAASNTTLGYGKGRAARAQLRQAVLAPKDSNMKDRTVKPSISKKSVDLDSLSPSEYVRLHGEPKFLSEMWWKCRSAGLVKMPGDEDTVAKQEDVNAASFQGFDIEGLHREEAEQEFELVLA